MNLQKKVAVLATLLATIGVAGCDNDSDSCSLTEEDCQAVSKTLDAQKCECVSDDVTPDCPLTEAMCQSANKKLDAQKCECVSTDVTPDCLKTQADCEAENKKLDAQKCECFVPDCLPDGSLYNGEKCQKGVCVNGECVLPVSVSLM